MWNFKIFVCCTELLINVTIKRRTCRKKVELKKKKKVTSQRPLFRVSCTSVCADVRDHVRLCLPHSLLVSIFSSLFLSNVQKLHYTRIYIYTYTPSYFYFFVCLSIPSPIYFSFPLTVASLQHHAASIADYIPVCARAKIIMNSHKSENFSTNHSSAVTSFVDPYWRKV